MPKKLSRLTSKGKQLSRSKKTSVEVTALSPNGKGAKECKI